MTFDEASLDRARELLESNVGDVYSGAALAVGTSTGPAAEFCVGQRDPGGDPVTPETLFDLASVTKAVATTTVALRLAERGDLALDASLSECLEPLSDDERGRIPVRSLLTHTSGLPPYKSFPFGWDSPEALLESIYDSPISVVAAPDELFVYSGLNFVLLADVVRSVTGTSLATAFDEIVATPLALGDTAFGPLPESTPVAATRDRRWRERVLRGEIHDYMGAVMEGEAGNAGLFATAGDLATIATAYLNAGARDGPTLLGPSTIDAIQTDQVSSVDERQGLGWRLGAETRPAIGWSEDAFGHTGFTGTSLWIDPQQDLFAVVLTNRLLTSDDPEPIGRLRTRIHEAVAAATGSGHVSGR